MKKPEEMTEEGSKGFLTVPRESRLKIPRCNLLAHYPPTVVFFLIIDANTESITAQTAHLLIWTKCY